MKIALVVPLDFTAALCCEEWIKDLKIRSNDELVVIGEHDANSQEYAETLKGWNVNFERVSMTRHINPWRDIIYTKSLYKIFSKYNVDIVLNTCTKPNIYGPIAAKFAGVECVQTSVWGRGTAYLDEATVSRKLLRSVLDVLYRLSFSLSTYTWFTNRNDMEYFINKGIVDSKKTILTRNYIDVEKYSPRVLTTEKKQNLMNELGLSESDKVVISSGRMIWPKGVREFAEAAVILEKEYPYIKFLLIGAEEPTSPDTVPVEYLQKHSNSANFKWLGFRTDVLDLYALSDLAALPSYYREGGYPRGLTEPMAMGKAVIAADTPDCRSPVENGKNGYIVQPKNSAELAKRISTILSDDTLISKFGAYSLNKARMEYDERVVIKEMTDEFFGRISTN